MDFVNVTDILTSSTEEMPALYNFMSPIVWLGVGIVITFLLLIALRNAVIGGVENITSKHSKTWSGVSYENTSEGQYRKSHGEDIYD